MYTKQSAVAVNIITSTSGICQGENWRAARVAPSMSGWMVEGVGVADCIEERVGVAVVST
jgi:hypothetical protein